MLTIAPRTRTVVQNVLAELPKIAPSLIRSSASKGLDDTPGFAREPDNPRYHNQQWHQHGILTHSRLFQVYLEKTTVKLLQEWGLGTAVNAALSYDIDGWSKWQLLQVAAVLHDVGKFTARTYKRPKLGSSLTWHFGGHEEHSGYLIRNGPVNELLRKQNLTGNQIEYIAACAERHFKLGALRNKIKTGEGYTMGFATSSRLLEAVDAILRSPVDAPYALEIFLFFLADNLSKVDGRLCATAQTDEGIEKERQRIIRQLEVEHLPPGLINGALQMPVNIKVSRRALERWAVRR